MVEEDYLVKGIGDSLFSLSDGAGSATLDSHESVSPLRGLEVGLSTPTTRERKMSLLMKSGGSLNSTLSAITGGSKILADKGGSASKKRTPALSDKKTNPDFFRKLENARNMELRASGDWQIEVAVPRGVSPTDLSPQQGSPTTLKHECEQLEHQGTGMDSGTASSPTLGNGFGGFLTSNEATYMELRFEAEAGRQPHELPEKSESASMYGRLVWSLSQ